MSYQKESLMKYFYTKCSFFMLNHVFISDLIYKQWNIDKHRLNARQTKFRKY